MVTKSIFEKCVFAVIFLLCACEGRKIKRKADSVSDVRNYLPDKTVIRNSSDAQSSRGFFVPGGLFTLGKVLNFFPVGGERECQPSGYKTARAGICLNPYDCRQRDGQSAGDCARGLGVCCVFEVSCGGTVQNNLTYFVSPGFPEPWAGEQDCDVTIEKAHAGIMQFRIDFVHFTIGQPNRLTGECDEDVMIVGEGENEFRTCGQNHGQHIYFTLPTESEAREADELPSASRTKLSVRMRGADMPRLWLLRLAQLPLAQAAPHDCRQYHTGNNGTIKTFNYAVNGRYLANQDYKACVRRNKDICSIRYSPCDNRSFRIGSQQGQNSLEPGPGGLGGPGTGFYGPDGAYAGPAVATTPLAGPALDQQGADTMNDMVEEEMMPADETQPQEDQMEGSGADPQVAPAIQPTPVPSLASRIWSYIWPPWPWQGRAARSIAWSRWSPYAQHYAVAPDDNFRYSGYGSFGLFGFGRLRCQDRITIPCENEYFVAGSSAMSGVCDPHHCGSSFCPGAGPKDCHVETSISPFAVTMHFGPPTPKQNPEENIGACLRFMQMPCET